MSDQVKKMVIGLLIVIALISIGYAGYKLYNYAVEDATKRIKQGVTEGVKEGVGEGIGGAFNPFELIKKIAQ